MNLDALFNNPNEKPLDSFPADGGFVGIFRTIACVGDSLSSGEFECHEESGKVHYCDFYEYSWGQYLGRMAGSTVYNFSKGGMTASDYMGWFADEMDFWNPEKKAQAYIIALGANDIVNLGQPVGTVDDIDLSDWRNNQKTFAGYYGQVIARYKEMQPKAKFFLVTLPNVWGEDERIDKLCAAHAELMYRMAELFDNCYVIDLHKYAPAQTPEFKEKFYLHHHQNPMGYLLTGKMMVSYIDYIIRHNMKDFKQVGFIGTPFYMDYLDEK